MPMPKSFIRIIQTTLLFFVVYVIFFGFRLVLDIEKQNRAVKQQEIEARQIVLQREKEDQKRLILELKHQKELRRRNFTLERRSVIEPEITLEHSELLKNYYIAVPTPVEPWTDETFKLLKSPLGQQILSDLLTNPEDIPNFKTLTFQERTFKAIFEFFDPIFAEGKVDVKTDPLYKDLWKIYERLEDILYPWIKPYWKNVYEINKKNKDGGKGIVMCVGNNQFQHAAVAVKAIRQVLESDIPIEIFYIDDYDLSEKNRQYLTSIPNVKTTSLIQMIDDRYTDFRGWDVKPFAILASSFSEVILMDADVYFFKKPEELFDDEGYNHTGALFFLDRTLFNNFNAGKLWLRSFLPTYSSYVEESRWWKTTSAHEQESGVVVINKKKALLGLLSTCKMNDKNEREKVSYKHVHGDKETFWIGFEMVQTPYAFVKSYGAVIGGLGDAGKEGTVCGNQLHIDVSDNRPWWWNGGILRDKNRWSDRYMEFTHFSEGNDWDFETSCINEKDKIQALNEKERQIGYQIIELDKKRRLET